MIKIEIIKTERGWNYRNSESRKLVGTVNEGTNKPGVYIWESFDEAGFSNLDGAHTMLRASIARKAHELGTDIEFTNI